MKLSIIYPYRNRDILRVQKSLKSLQSQTNKNFEVYFVNYGSDAIYTNQIESLLKNFEFVKYSYLYTLFQPWNKSKAINSVLKNLETGCFFVADIDMIFHSTFIEKALRLSKTNEAWYFQVGFLGEGESKTSKKFEDYNIKFKSNKGATGLTLCPVKAAKRIRGFDEFYHFWGGEDTDFHIRLKNSGCIVKYFDEELLMLHQWHEIYRNRESANLTANLQISGIVQFNHYYLEQTARDKKAVVNNDVWGETQSKEQFEKLVEYSNTTSKKISSSCVKIDYFLFHELPNLKPGIYNFKITADQKNISLKATLKNVLKKSKYSYYSLKDINDKLLFHLITFYRNNPYYYRVSKDLKSITFVINKL
ncbi:glycosyltransferase family 2 protein [Aequorivita marisscotiae]|uniref:Galactosyltransferase-related protein n=1 Tax=Aequorivita marisscotiae TaxID=3040348 RepID=A0ABY8KX28_9FLAO|nr:galactosyltransferase-related protein [Aequorivita sp. Ant34-E75]WGF92740.1 galactosyltransferase-related protein [Aequorivita sp. Ant34-E75]